MYRNLFRLPSVRTRGFCVVCTISAHTTKTGAGSKRRHRMQACLVRSPLYLQIWIRQNVYHDNAGITGTRLKSGHRATSVSCFVVRRTPIAVSFCSRRHCPCGYLPCNKLSHFLTQDLRCGYKILQNRPDNISVLSVVIGSRLLRSCTAFCTALLNLSTPYLLENRYIPTNTSSNTADRYAALSECLDPTE